MLIIFSSCFLLSHLFLRSRLLWNSSCFLLLRLIIDRWGPISTFTTPNLSFINKLRRVLGFSIFHNCSSLNFTFSLLLLNISPSACQARLRRNIFFRCRLRLFIKLLSWALLTVFNLSLFYLFSLFFRPRHLFLEVI